MDLINFNEPKFQGQQTRYSPESLKALSACYIIMNQNLNKIALVFFENERQQIRKVVDYAKNYIYQTDDGMD